MVKSSSFRAQFRTQDLGLGLSGSVSVVGGEGAGQTSKCVIVSVGLIQTGLPAERLKPRFLRGGGWL